MPDLQMELHAGAVDLTCEALIMQQYAIQQRGECTPAACPFAVGADAPLQSHGRPVLGQICM